MSGVLGTLLLAWHWPLPAIFPTDGFFALCAALAIFVMGRVERGPMVAVRHSAS